MEYYRLCEEDIINNNHIKLHVVEADIDIYNDIARKMANKIRENNEKNLIT